MSEVVGKLEFFAETEVCQLDCAILEEHIVRLYVPMDDAVLVQGPVPVEQLPEYSERLALTEPSSFGQILL